MTLKTKIKVMVIDDSAMVRSLLTNIINSDSRMMVIATASDPFEARDLIKLHNPDVLTLDIEMPRMNGVAFLKNLMRLKPIPVIMISTLTQEGAPATFEALELGAVDFLGKPQGVDESSLNEYSELIIDKIYWASKANVNRSSGALNYPIEPIKSLPSFAIRTGFLCAVGASTGGTEAIKDVLMALPEDSPPIVMAQHIPEGFSTSYAKRLAGLCAVKVFEAEQSQPIVRGCAYLAPGHSHLTVVKKNGEYLCRLDQNPPVNRHRPSVEVLFNSVAETAGANSLIIMLTGMGADGARAMLGLKELGAYTIVQDEASSVVWGMPGAAFKLGAAQAVLPLHKIAQAIIQRAKK